MFIFPTGGVFGKGDRYNSVCTVLISAPPKEIAWQGVKFISPGPYNVIFPNSEKILQKANKGEKLEWKNPSILCSCISWIHCLMNSVYHALYMQIEANGSQ
jgi:hypothetical protein